MYERFTDRARKVMQLANMEAQRFNHSQIYPEHVLLGILKEGAGIAVEVLNAIGVGDRITIQGVRDRMAKGPEMVTMGKLPHTDATKFVIQKAIEEAKGLGHNHVGTEHVLLGLLRIPDGTVNDLLFVSAGVTAEMVREQIREMFPPKPAPSIPQPGDPYFDQGTEVLEGVWTFTLRRSPKIVPPADEIEGQKCLNIVRQELEKAKTTGQTAAACALLKVLMRLEAK